jgi:Cu-processing system ATP-binding protein
VVVGAPPRSVSHPEAREAITFMPQKVSFPEALTGREVVDFYRRLRGGAPDRTEDVLRMTALDGVARRQVGTYSGGMTQRLALAVAALPEVPLMLLDEPTSSLDADGLSAFYDLVERLRHRKRTILFTSHHWGDVERIADRVAVLVDGVLVADLPRRTLAEQLAQRGVMRISLDACPEPLLARIQGQVPGARWSQPHLMVPGTTGERTAALEFVRAAGLEIRGLVSEDGRLDVLYRELALGGAR